MKVCVLGDQLHCDEAKANDVPCMDAEGSQEAQQEQEVGQEASQKLRCFPCV
eukprot:UN20388